jgi:hypothetical protein
MERITGCLNEKFGRNRAKNHRFRPIFHKIWAELKKKSSIPPEIFYLCSENNNRYGYLDWKKRRSYAVAQIH